LKPYSRLTLGVKNCQDQDYRRLLLFVLFQRQINVD
jgi:hypothetical protein